MRQQWIVGLEASRSEPQVLASQAIEQHFNHYPQGDVRNSMSIDEQLAALKALKLEDVIAFHRDYYGASHGELAIVGDFDKAAVSKTIADNFTGWNSKASYAPVLSTNVEKAPLHVMLNAPDKENGFYTARLNVDLNSNDADYPALVCETRAGQARFGRGAGFVPSFDSLRPAARPGRTTGRPDLAALCAGP